MRQGVTISERRACALIGIARMTLRRVIEEPAENVVLQARMIDLAQEAPVRL